MKKIILPILLSTMLIKASDASASFYTSVDVLKLDSIYRFAATVGKNFTKQFDSSLTVAFQEDTDSTRDGVSFIAIDTSYKFHPNRSPAIFGMVAKSVSKTIGDFTVIDIGYKFASKFSGGTRYDFQTKFDYTRVASQDSFNFVIGGNFTFDLNKQLSLTAGADFTLNDKFNFIKCAMLNTSNLLARLQLNYYYNGLWNLYYNNVIGEGINIFGLKYSKTF